MCTVPFTNITLMRMVEEESQSDCDDTHQDEDYTEQGCANKRKNRIRTHEVVGVDENAGSNDTSATHSRVRITPAL